MHVLNQFHHRNETVSIVFTFGWLSFATVIHGSQGTFEINTSKNHANISSIAHLTSYTAHCDYQNFFPDYCSTNHAMIQTSPWTETKPVDTQIFRNALVSVCLYIQSKSPQSKLYPLRLFECRVKTHADTQSTKRFLNNCTLTTLPRVHFEGLQRVIGNTLTFLCQRGLTRVKILTCYSCPCELNCMTLKALSRLVLCVSSLPWVQWAIVCRIRIRHLLSR